MSSTQLIYLLFAGVFWLYSGNAQDKQNLPLIDISGETDRHVIIAAGTGEGTLAELSENKHSKK